MVRGVVMKITKNCIVVLCDDGKFRNLPLSPDLPTLGQSIDIPDMAKISKQQPKRSMFGRRWIVAAAASLLLLIGLSMGIRAIPGMSEPVALVAVDINPSIELLIDKKGKVDQVTLVNEDAKRLIEQKELIDQPFYKAVQAIVAKAKTQGYLDVNTNKKYVYLSVVDLDDRKQTAFDLDVEKLSETVKEFDFEVYHADQQKRQQARKMGLTLNKYIVYKQAQKKGITLNVEELRNHSIESSLTDAGMSPQTIFDEEEERTPRAENKETKMGGQQKSVLVKDQSELGKGRSVRFQMDDLANNTKDAPAQNNPAKEIQQQPVVNDQTDKGKTVQAYTQPKHQNDEVINHGGNNEGIDEAKESQKPKGSLIQQEKQDESKNLEHPENQANVPTDQESEDKVEEQQVMQQEKLDKQVEQEQSDKPENMGEPDQPDNPDKPDKPDKIDKPEKQDKHEKDKPNKANKPDNRDHRE